MRRRRITHVQLSCGRGAFVAVDDIANGTVKLPRLAAARHVVRNAGKVGAFTALVVGSYTAASGFTQQIRGVDDWINYAWGGGAMGFALQFGSAPLRVARTVAITAAAAGAVGYIIQRRKGNA